jgi:DNA (cytosine-5)-methyltransferase 1
LNDARGTLFHEFVRILQVVRPRGFLFENVYGITGANGGQAWAQIRDAFTEAGYRVFHRILDAADYGVPQHRERAIIVGVREGTFAFPRPTHGPDSPNDRPYYTAGLAVSDAAFETDTPAMVNGRYGHLLSEVPPGLNYSFFTERMGHPRPVFAWRSKFSDFLYKADPSVPVRTIKAQGSQYAELGYTPNYRSVGYT